MYSIRQLAGLCAIGGLLLIMGAAQAQSVSGTQEGISVKQFGAVGDGVADDTGAFEAAITQAKTTKSTVLVPSGRYKITRTLTLGMQSLLGQTAAAWVGDDNSMPVIVPATKDGPCVRLLGGGSVHGLQFQYDWGKSTPSPRPATIELAGVGCRVSDVKIQGAWDGIMADGKSNVGRALIQNCFIVDVHHIGVRMTGTWDVSWISKVEVWSPSSKTFLESGVGFQLGKNDVLLVSDCLVFSGQIGYQLVDSIPGCKIKGGTWGSISNSSADFCGIGIQIDGTHTVSFAGGTYWTHFGGMQVKGKGAQVRVTGLELAANGAPALSVDGGDLVTVGSCQLRREHPGFKVPSLRVTGGNSTVVTGCVISSSSQGVEVKQGLKDVLINNNVVRENVKPRDKAVNNQ